MEKFNNIIRNHYYLLTSLLMFLSFPSYDFILFKFFPLFAWFSLVPLFMFNRGRSMKDVFFYSFIAGLAGNFLTYGWIGNFGAKVPGGYFVIVIFLIPSLTAFFVLKIIFAEMLSRRFTGLDFLIYPSVWIIGDFVQASGFLAFPWTYIGYSQYPFTPFIQAASVTGILGINFIMILFNYAAASCIQTFIERERRLGVFFGGRDGRILSAAVLSIVLITAAGFYRISTFGDGSERGMRFSVVQTCISPWDNWTGNRYSYLGELMKYTRESLVSNPDFIIWSESATLETISFRAANGEDDLFDRQLLDFVREIGKPLLTGEIGVTLKADSGRLRFYPQNNAVLIHGDGRVAQTYAKINLVPFGEWFPYDKWLTSVKRLATSMGGSDFVPGRKPELFNMNGFSFGALICYEGIFFRLCRDYKRMGADFLINITNDGWTDKYSGHFQHFAASVFRSVENGLWVVRAGNTGVSAIIDPAGRIKSSMPILTKGSFSGRIDVSLNRQTVYQSAGDVILYMASFFIVVIMVILILRKYRERSGA